MPETPLFQIDVQISFGHCDPAGIVYYPNYLRWFDRCFHSFLQQHHGGHAALCARLGAEGIGLMGVKTRFLSPGRDGDLMVLELAAPDWRGRSFALPYRGRVGDRILLEGTETRGLFVQRDGRLTAAPVDALRAVFGEGEHE